MSAASRDVTREPDQPGPISTAFGCRWGWLLTLGLAQLIAGSLSIAVPLTATLFTTAAIACALVLTGAFFIAHALRVRRWSGFGLHVLTGLAYSAAGILILMNPLSGALGLTLILAATLLAVGGIRTVLAFRVRPRDGWRSFLASGIASILLGGTLLLGWPADALWALGLLLGIELIFAAAMNILLALSCRWQRRQSPAEVEAGASSSL